MELELVPKDEWVGGATPGNPQEASLRYAGPDRRKTPRRSKVNRRVMLRFDDTPDRRQTVDRRRGTRMWEGREF